MFCGCFAKMETITLLVYHETISVHSQQKDRTNPMTTPSEEYIDNYTLPDFTFPYAYLNDAAHLINLYVEKRLKNIAATTDTPLALMVSGGIDSLHTAAIAAHTKVKVEAFTFVWENDQEGMNELNAAKEVCEQLEIPHHTVAPDEEKMQGLICSAITLLDTTEPWEILAGVILHAVAGEVNRVLPGAPIVSAAGADSLFLGGKEFTPRDTEEETLQAWEEAVVAELKKSFVRERFIPDFYERILGSDVNYFKVWQTHEAIETVAKLHPYAIRGGQWDQDKVVIRYVLEKFGISPQIAGRGKNPMQVSSGGLQALEDCARGSLAKQFEGRTYSDPLTEDRRFTVARLFLNQIGGVRFAK